MMPDQTQELLKMKKFIDESKTKSAEIRGQISQLEKQRSEEFGCATDVDADAYIKELETDVARLELEIQEGVKTIQDELGWGTI